MSQLKFLIEKINELEKFNSVQKLFDEVEKQPSLGFLTTFIKIGKYRIRKIDEITYCIFRKRLHIHYIKGQECRVSILRAYYDFLRYVVYQSV